MKLIITRPQIDAAPLAERLKALGHSVVIAPVLDIVPRLNVAIPHLPYQAICLSSANGMRCLNVALDQSIPVFAVGEQSAIVARVRGFQHVEAKGGDVDGLVRHIKAKLKPDDGPLLYLSGAETSGDLEGQLTRLGYKVIRAITYDAHACALDQHTAAIQSSNGVLLYSPRTAKLWLGELERLNLVKAGQNLSYFCLSQQVAKILPQNWHKSVAKSPTEESLLALLDLAGEAE